MRLIQMLGATGDCGRREGAQGSGGSCAGAPAQAVDDPGGTAGAAASPRAGEGGVRDPCVPPDWQLCFLSQALIRPSFSCPDLQ